MGYYEQKNTKKNWNWLKSALLGAIIGSGFTLGILIFCSYFNVPFESEQTVAEVEDKSIVKQIGEHEVMQADMYTTVTEAVEKASGAVVGIANIQDHFFYNQQQEAGAGSGVIYKESEDKAYIVTNNHVINGAQKIEVTLSDGTKVPAKLLGADVFTDLAVLEISAEHVTTVAVFGDSDHLQLGEPVIAIGNPLGLRFSGSVTQGIISGKERTIPIDIDRDGSPDWQADVIQTDAAINPGNSGGALVNMQGEVIGINTMKIAQQSVEGIGLSIPMSVVKPVIEDLEIYHEVQRPYMGVELVSIAEIPGFHLKETFNLPEEVKEGVAIKDVMPQTPAHEAGLKPLDVIVALDGQNIIDDIDVRKHLYNQKEMGDHMEVTFYRDGEKQTTTLVLTSNNMN